jgi:signaling repeat-containing protein
MHYTGKLALKLPVALLLDWRLVLLSLLISIIGSGATLLVTDEAFQVTFGEAGTVQQALKLVREQDWDSRGTRSFSRRKKRARALERP